MSTNEFRLDEDQWRRTTEKFIELFGKYGRVAYDRYFKSIVAADEPEPPTWDRLTLSQRKAWCDAALAARSVR